MRFGSTAKVLLKCKLKYYRISECRGLGRDLPGGPFEAGDSATSGSAVEHHSTHEILSAVEVSPAQHDGDSPLDPIFQVQCVVPLWIGWIEATNRASPSYIYPCTQTKQKPKHPVQATGVLMDGHQSMMHVGGWLSFDERLLCPLIATGLSFQGERKTNQEVRWLATH